MWIAEPERFRLPDAGQISLVGHQVGDLAIGLATIAVRVRLPLDGRQIRLLPENNVSGIFALVYAALSKLAAKHRMACALRHRKETIPVVY
jgi:hypothetical protein